MNKFIAPKTNVQKFAFYLEVLDFLGSIGECYDGLTASTCDRVAEAILTGQYRAERGESGGLVGFLGYSVNGDELFVTDIAVLHERPTTLSEMRQWLNSFPGVRTVRWRKRGKHLVQFQTREGKHGRR